MLKPEFALAVSWLEMAKTKAEQLLGENVEETSDYPGAAARAGEISVLLLCALDVLKEE